MMMMCDEARQIPKNPYPYILSDGTLPFGGEKASLSLNELLECNKRGVEEDNT